MVLAVASVLAVIMAVAPSVSALDYPDIRNATLKCARQIGYEHWQPLATVVLKRGKQTLPDQTQLMLVETYSSFGNLDGHSGTDAAVVLSQISPGTGSWGHLLLLEDRGGKPYCRAAVALGDRTQIHSIKIAGRKVRIDLTTHGPHDPMCCPHRRETMTIDAGETLHVERADNPSGTGLRYTAAVEELASSFELNKAGDDWHGTFGNARLEIWGPPEDIQRATLSIESNQMPLLKTFLTNTMPMCALELEKWSLSVVSRTPRGAMLSQSSRHCLNRQIILQTSRAASQENARINAVVLSAPDMTP